MNSIKITHTELRAGIFERLPNAKTIPIGKENDIPVIPITVSYTHLTLPTTPYV